LETYSSPDSSGFRFTLEHFEEGKLVSKLMCDRIQWNSATKQWRMEGCSRRTNISELQESLEFFAVLDSALGFSPNDFARPLLEDAALLNNAELDALIDRERLKGNARIEPYLVEKYNRVSIPFSAFILTLIGASLSSRKVRGGIGIQLGIGVGLCFVYIMMMRFALTFATKGSLPPIIASWTPNLLFGTLSIYFYRVAPK
jgi:lipopolysaccharide export system permease protein